MHVNVTTCCFLRTLAKVEHMCVLPLSLCSPTGGQRLKKDPKNYPPQILKTLHQVDEGDIASRKQSIP